jgi:hypothetical protein
MAQLWFQPKLDLLIYVKTRSLGLGVNVIIHYNRDGWKEFWERQQCQLRRCVQRHNPCENGAELRMYFNSLILRIIIEEKILNFLFSEKPDPCENLEK